MAYSVVWKVQKTSLNKLHPLEAMISLKEAVSPLSCTQHMIKEYLLNKQRKESGFTFFVVGRKNKAQSGDGFGPKYQLK